MWTHKFRPENRSLPCLFDKFDTETPFKVNFGGQINARVFFATNVFAPLFLTRKIMFWYTQHACWLISKMLWPGPNCRSNVQEVSFSPWSSLEYLLDIKRYVGETPTDLTKTPISIPVPTRTKKTPQIKSTAKEIRFGNNTLGRSVGRSVLGLRSFLWSARAVTVNDKLMELK